MEEAIVIAVSSRPELYDSSSYYYRDRIKKDLAWKKVSEETGLPDAVCRSKWKGLRDTYLKERRKEMEKPSGSAATGRKRWRFSAVMSFLDPFIAPRPTTSNMGVQETAEDLPPGPYDHQNVDQESDEAPEAEDSGAECPLPAASAAPSSASWSQGPGPSIPAAAAPTPTPTPTGQRRRPRPRARPQEEPSEVELALLEELRRRPPAPQHTAVEHYLLSLAPLLEQLSLYDLESLKVKINKLILDHCTVVLNLEHSAP